MGRPMRALFAVLAIVATLIAPASAQTASRTPNLEAELHSSRAVVAPGERFTILLTQRMREGWHTYWRNPGVSGEPMRLTWDAPGFTIGEPQWPTPSLLLLGPL